jgi:hypothetical protein
VEQCLRMQPGLDPSGSAGLCSFSLLVSGLYSRMVLSHEPAMAVLDWLLASPELATPPHHQPLALERVADVVQEEVAMVRIGVAPMPRPLWKRDIGQDGLRELRMTLCSRVGGCGARGVEGCDATTLGLIRWRWWTCTRTCSRPRTAR